MSKKTFLLPVATTLAALLGGVGTGAASVPFGAAAQADASGLKAKSIGDDALILKRTVSSVRDMKIGEQFADHYSHTSHASHESHSSHYSGS